MVSAGDTEDILPLSESSEEDDYSSAHGSQVYYSQ